MTDDQPNQSPAEALAAIEASRKAVHDRVAGGGWRYDLTYSVITAGMVAGQVFDVPYNVLASSLGVLGLMVIFQRETKRTGLRLTGLSPRWARWVAVGIGLAFAAAMITLVVIRRQSPETPVGLIAGVAAVVTFGVALIGSRIWRRVYRAEMRLHR
jgi:hypothetical protein